MKNTNDIKKLGQTPEIIRVLPCKEITFTARQLAAKSLKLLEEFVDGKTSRGEVVPISVRFKAAKEILDRAIGQAPQRVDISTEITQKLSAEELQKYAKQIITREARLLEEGKTDEKGEKDVEK